MMRLPIGVRLAVACAAQAVVCAAQAQSNDLTLKIPPVKTSLNLEGQPIGITAWGTIAAVSAGVFRLAVTADLGEFQERLTPILAAELNQSDRCGDRITLQRASIAPIAPSSVLTATLHYERFFCAKALGKEIVKKLVGGDAEVEVNLTPSVMENELMVTAEVRKLTAGGSLGEVLRSGDLGKLLREKIATAIQENIQRAVNRKTALPAGMEESASIRSVEFADGGGGRLWVTVSAEARFSEARWREIEKDLVRER
jgi:hypothetical protein